MSRLFNDPVKAEESFQILNQLKDMNIWKLLKTLLDPCTTFRHAWTVRVFRISIQVKTLVNTANH